MKMETLTVKNGLIPKVVNGSFLYVDKEYNNNFVNGKHYRLPIGLYYGVNNKWQSVNGNSSNQKIIVPNDVVSFTYSNNTLSLTLKDNTVFNVLLNDIKICLNYPSGTTSYTYIVPYDLKINTVESSGPTYTLTKSGIPYVLGETLNKFDELLIEVNTNGLIILNGIKVI